MDQLQLISTSTYEKKIQKAITNLGNDYVLSLNYDSNKNRHHQPTQHINGVLRKVELEAKSQGRI